MPALLGTVNRFAAWIASVALIAAALFAFLWHGENLPVAHAAALLAGLLWTGHLVSMLLLRLSDAEPFLEPRPVYQRLHLAAVALPLRPLSQGPKVFDTSLLPPWMNVERPQEHGVDAWRIAPRKVA